MAVEADIAALLQTLSRVDPSQLPLLLLQQPSLPRVIATALRKASAEVSTNEGIPSRATAALYLSILSILEHAAQGDDPSLARRLLPSHRALLDFVYLSTLEYDSQSSSSLMRARRLARSMVDPITSDEYTIAAVKALQSQTEQGSSLAASPEVRSTVQLVTSLLVVLPIGRTGGAKTQETDIEKRRQDGIDEVAETSVMAYEHLSTSQHENRVTQLATKAAWIDLVSALLSRRVEQHNSQRVARILCSVSSTNPPAASISLSTQPLVDLPLLEDVLMAVPHLEGSLRTAISASTSPSDKEERARALKVLDTTMASLRSKALVGHSGNLSRVGGGWSDLISHYQQRESLLRPSDQRASPGPSRRGKERALDDREEELVPPALLETLQALMPDLAADEAKLRRILRQSKFHGRTDEEIVQMLFEDPSDPTQQELINDVRDQPVAAAASSSSRPMNPRANVFDSMPAPSESARIGGSLSKSSELDTMPTSLKASILARVQAQVMEDKEAEEQEWNPFVAEERGMMGREIGFEDELEEDGSSNTGATMMVRGRFQDDEDTAEDSDAPPAAPTTGRDTPTGPSSNSTSSVASERLAEKLLITAYHQQGPQLFARGDASVRKSAARKALREQLSRETGRVYDDQLIESWGVMFERNVSPSGFADKSLCESSADHLPLHSVFLLGSREKTHSCAPHRRMTFSLAIPTCRHHPTVVLVRMDPRSDSVPIVAEVVVHCEEVTKEAVVVEEEDHRILAVQVAVTRATIDPPRRRRRGGTKLELEEQIVKPGKWEEQVLACKRRCCSVKHMRATASYVRLQPIALCYDEMQTIQEQKLRRLVKAIDNCRLSSPGYIPPRRYQYLGCAKGEPTLAAMVKAVLLRRDKPSSVHQVKREEATAVRASPYRRFAADNRGATPYQRRRLLLLQSDKVATKLLSHMKAKRISEGYKSRLFGSFPFSLFFPINPPISIQA